MRGKAGRCDFPLRAIVLLSLMAFRFEFVREKKLITDRQTDGQTDGLTIPLMKERF